MPAERLGAAIRRLRDARGLAQEDLAYAAGITSGTLSRTETGETSPRWETIEAIAGALDVTLVELARAVEREK